MKITFLVSGNVRSNFSFRAVALARALSKLGHDVSLIAPKADKYNDFIPENITHIDEVRILQPFQFHTRRVEINLLPYVFGVLWLLVCEKPDLVYVYKPTPISVVGFVAKLLYKTPTLVDFDDLGSEVMKIEGHPWHQHTLVGWSEYMAAKYADKLVVTSTFLQNMYREQFPHKSIYVLPNGVEADWFDQTLSTENPKRIVFMGSVNRKNILEPLFLTLPDILKIHSDVEIVIVGDGQYLHYFKDLAVQLGVSKQITFTGWLTLEKAKSHLRFGDIGYNFMPDSITNKAASNMKVPQYMARGVVPLVTDIGDLPKTVDYGNAGYIVSTTLENSLLQTLLHALDDKERMKKAEYARNFSLKNLQWDVLVKSFNGWLNKKIF